MTHPFPFNLMFKTTIGPEGTSVVISVCVADVVIVGAMMFKWRIKKRECACVYKKCVCVCVIVGIIVRVKR